MFLDWKLSLCLWLARHAPGSVALISFPHFLSPHIMILFYFISRVLYSISVAALYFCQQLTGCKAAGDPLQNLKTGNAWASHQYFMAGVGNIPFIFHFILSGTLPHFLSFIWLCFFSVFSCFFLSWVVGFFPLTITISSWLATFSRRRKHRGFRTVRPSTVSYSHVYCCRFAYRFPRHSGISGARWVTLSQTSSPLHSDHVSFASTCGHQFRHQTCLPDTDSRGNNFASGHVAIFAAVASNSCQQSCCHFR